MKLKKLLSLVLVLALVLAYAPSIKVHAVDKTSAEALVNQAPTLVSDTSAPADGYNGIEVGRVVTFDHPLYGLKVEVAGNEGGNLILNIDLTTKTKEAKSMGYDGCYVEDGTSTYLNGEMFSANTGSFYSNVIIESREEKVQTDDYDIFKGKVAIPAADVPAGLNTFGFKIKPNVRLLSLYPNDWYEGTSFAEFELVKSPGSYKIVQGGNNESYKVTTNAITLGSAIKSSKKGVTEAGTIIKYRESGDSSWTEKVVKDGGKITLTGLKTSTKYEIKGANYVIDNGMKYTGVEGTAITINTASPAPAIKSVKISKVKQYKVTVPGEWRNHKWYPAHKVWKTSFKAKITFKNKPKNISSLYAQFGASGHLTQNINSATTTNSVTIGGKMKGKKIKVSAYSYSDIYANGKSAVATKTVKLK